MNQRKYNNIGIVADFSSKSASAAYTDIMQRYPNLIDANALDVANLDVVVALGGDGLMLKVMHRYIDSDVKIFGMNRGSVGFLLNKYSPENLVERIENASSITLYPLEMTVEDLNGEHRTALAINEVSLLRETNQSAKLRIVIDGVERMPQLVCDGILVSTPAGSTAYNFAANGPIIPLNANVLAMTPISPFRPRRWRGALLSHKNEIAIDIQEPEKRPVSAVADFHEVRDVRQVKIKQITDKFLTLLFDDESNIEERIIKEQFLT